MTFQAWQVNYCCFASKLLLSAVSPSCPKAFLRTKPESAADSNLGGALAQRG